MVKVCILTASFGAGHNQVARTVRNYVLQVSEDNEVMELDILKETSEALSKVIVETYLQMLRTTPVLYKKIYEDADERDNSLKEVKSLSRRLFSLKLRKEIKAFRPDVIVCTHPFALGIGSYLKEKLGLAFHLYGIYTDYTPHGYWIQEHVDGYIVANEDIIPEMMDRGVTRDIIYPIGIPIDEKFEVSYDVEATKKKLGLDEREVFLIMGGSLGLGDMITAFERLVKWNRDVQIIALCGKNKKLFKALMELKPDKCDNIQILEYIDNVEEYLAIADLVITKPGGITITEAITMETPICLISPIPGQEQRNANYLLNSGVAFMIHNEEKYNFYGVLENALNSQNRMQFMAAMAKEKKKTGAMESFYQIMSTNLQQI